MFRLETAGEGRVKLVGRLDAAEADAATREFAQLQGPTEADCSELEYISSAGIAVLMVTYKRLRVGGHALKLSGLNPRVRNIFVYAGLAPLLGIE
jgi:anti-anti-sigma factor